jgi:hypothetical protein
MAQELQHLLVNTASHVNGFFETAVMSLEEPSIMNENTGAISIGCIHTSKSRR